MKDAMPVSNSNYDKRNFQYCYVNVLDMINVNLHINAMHIPPVMISKMLILLFKRHEHVSQCMTQGVF